MSTIKVTNLRHESATSDNISLNSSGQVGIGNTTPGALLHVGSSAVNGTIFVRSGSSDYMQIYSTSPDGSYCEIDSQREFRIRTEAGNMRFATANTDRLTINSAGRLAAEHATSNTHGYQQNCTNTSYTSTLFEGICGRAGSSLYHFAIYASGGGADNEFKMRGDGTASADGSWNGGGADYAEYFEWSDGNTAAEDRRGISVVLDGDKIREAVAGEDPIGVISGNPSVVGDADIDRWKQKYLRDDFGTYVQEDYEVQDDDGNTVVQQRRKLNPDYDPDQEYISREQRPEWDCVGLMGKLRIRKGQVTGARWIKMRDIRDTVEEWLVR